MRTEIWQRPISWESPLHSLARLTTKAREATTRLCAHVAGAQLGVGEDCISRNTWVALARRRIGSVTGDRGVRDVVDPTDQPACQGARPSLQPGFAPTPRLGGTMRSGVLTRPPMSGRTRTCSVPGPAKSRQTVSGRFGWEPDASAAICVFRLGKVPFLKMRGMFSVCTTIFDEISNYV